MTGVNGIQWYGERGILNALVVHAAESRKEIDLLKAIQWADGSVPGWIRDVIRVTFLVEFGFAQFGNPDVILVCEIKNAGRHVVFVEAKAVPYLASAIPNSQGIQDGFNSCINGQLALRFRLAAALVEWSGESGDLCEPADLHAAYRRSEGGLRDPMPRPRHLAKRSVLGRIRSAGLGGQPPSHYHFVALTTDKAPFWQDVEHQTCWPLFLDRTGRQLWSAIAAQVGWLSYEMVSKAIQPGSTFASALDTFVTPASSAKASVAESAVPRLVTHNRKEHPSLLPVLEELESRARRLFGNAVLVREGSTSIEIDGQVGIKLVPLTDTTVLLGISPVLEPELWTPIDLPLLRRIGVGQNAQPFQCCEIPANNAIELIEEVFLAVVNR